MEEIELFNNIVPYFSIIIVGIIVIMGYFYSKIISRIVIKLFRALKIKQHLGEKQNIQNIIEKSIIAFFIFLGIIYLGISNTQEVFFSIFDMIPKLITILLLFIMGSITINIIMWFLEKFLKYIRLESLLPFDMKKFVFQVFILFTKFILYLALARLIFELVEIVAIQRILDFILYPIIILFFFVLGIALINPVRDFFAKIYLFNLNEFRPGTIITLNGTEYTIKEVGNLYTRLENENKTTLMIPNKKLATKIIEFKRPLKDLDNLKVLKQTFVKQLKSHCGPATVEMILSIFGYKFSQVKLGKMMSTIKRDSESQVAGTHPQDIIKVIQKVTNNNVRASWISYEHILNLKDELIIWLKQGGLVIIDYKKKYLFPDAKFAHYSLCVGVRGDELLILDPGRESGGVYFSDYRDVLVGMNTYSKLIGGKRGYIITAPKGTEAYERIIQKRLFLDKSMYSEVSKNLDIYLSKLSNPSALTNIIPPFLRKYLGQFDNSQQITRVWDPYKTSKAKKVKKVKKKANTKKKKSFFKIG
jgi:hypothetical protein